MALFLWFRPLFLATPRVFTQTMHYAKEEKLANHVLELGMETVNDVVKHMLNKWIKYLAVSQSTLEWPFLLTFPESS